MHPVLSPKRSLHQNDNGSGRPAPRFVVAVRLCQLLCAGTIVRSECGTQPGDRVPPLIGVPRFELGTSPTRTERATRLRHTPSAYRLASSREPYPAVQERREPEHDADAPPTARIVVRPTALAATPAITKPTGVSANEPNESKLKRARAGAPARARSSASSRPRRRADPEAAPDHGRLRPVPRRERDDDDPEVVHANARSNDHAVSRRVPARPDERARPPSRPRSG